ncbi:MAG TPA: TlpA disulfide reductase family protein [Blastocatellia bacterium]|nr:TlpA disulfide reductase family protein [Blastocatellia bacterium]
MSRKKNPTRRRGLFLLAISAFMFSAIALTGCNDSETGPGAGGGIKVSPTPAVVSNVPQSLEQFRGKVVLLDLWATWCPPCRAEIPGFIRLQEKYRDKGFEIVGVSLDPVDPRGGGGSAAVAPFMKQMNINYTIWMVNNINALGKYPLGQGYPTTYLIDREGRTVKQIVGMQPEAAFENDIKSLL